MLELGNGILALCDTGSVVSLLDIRTFTAIQQQYRSVILVKPTSLRLHSVTGNDLQVSGRCTLSIGELPKQEYILVRNLPYPVILGADFLHKY